MIELPLRHPEIFDNMGFKQPKGVHLNGPPGIVKTLLANAVANEACAHIVTISGSEIVSEYCKNIEKFLHEKFEEAVNNAPSIIFIDNIYPIAIDSIVKTSLLERHLVSQLIELLDGIRENNRVFSISATIDSKSFDPQLRRSGRFDIEINLPFPDKEGRVKILDIHSQGIPLENDINFEEIANLTEGFTGTDIKNLVQMTGLQALTRGIESIPIHKNSLVEEPKTVLISQKDLISGLEFVKSKMK